MAFDAGLAARVREILANRPDVEEKKMFGGLTFMVAGHMCCGVMRNDLIVRMAPETATRAIKERNTRLFDFTGKPMKGMVSVSDARQLDEAALGNWVEHGTDFVATLPSR